MNKKNKTVFSVVVVCVFMFVIAMAAAVAIMAAGWYLNTDAGHQETVEIMVEQGSSLSQVAQQLEIEGVIRDARLFTVMGRFKGAERSIHAGRYQIEPGLSAIEVLDLLRTGRVNSEKVTIPEGLTIPAIARILNRRFDMDSTAILNLAMDSEWSQTLGVDAPILEGYLFPATYPLDHDMSEEEVLKVMVEQTQQALTEEYQNRAQELGYSLHEIMTLASIIEKEAMLDEERDIISGVFHNRLRRGIPLAADPTVKYAIGRPNMRLYQKHLSHPSPYNTYVHAGLPPGPICSPGKASIHAALYPRNVPYLFFMARGDGSHIFSISNAEHNRARAWVKRNQR